MCRTACVSVTAEFRLEKPTQEAVDDVRSAVQSVRSDLPSDVRDPIVSKMNLSGAPILAFTIRSSKMDDEALSWFVDNTIARALLGVRGVGSVARVGGVTREVQVALDPLKLQSLGATAADISRQLKLVQTESAGGRADLGGSEQPMRTLATVATVEELSQPGADPVQRQACAPGRGGHRQGHRGRATQLGHAERQAGGGLRDHPQQGRQ